MSVQKTQSISYNLYQSGKLDETNLDAQQSKQLKGTTGWTADFSDPISFLDLLSKGNAYNYGKWESTTYNKNISLSKTTGSTAARWKAMVKADQALVEDQGVTPLYYTNEATLVKTKVKGVVFNGAGAPYNFKEAYIK